MAKPLATILKKYSDVIAGKLPASEINALTLGKEPGVDYAPKMADEREFVTSHSVEKFPDRVGNGPDVYNGAKIKQAIDDRHGHIPNPKSKNQYKQANEEVDLDEAKDDREYDYEGEMAVTKLKTICRHAEHLIDMMKPNTNLPEWVQSKIVKAEDYISTAHDYLMSEMNEEVEELDELTGYRKKKLFGKDKLVAVANRAVNRMKLPPDKGKLSPEELASNKKNRKVSQMAFDRMGEEVELDEGGSQYRSTAGSGRNTNPNLSKLARKLSFEKPKYFRPPGEKSKAENRALLDAEVAKFMKKGGKIRKEEVEELDEAKCNMTEAGTMCEVHGMKACPKTKASDNQPMMTKDGKKKLLLEPQVNEESTSQAQQKLMAMAYRYKQNPDSMPDASAQVKELAKTMTIKQLRDFAKTKRSELPKKVQKESAAVSTTPIKMPSNPSNETADYNSGYSLGRWNV